MQGKILPQVFLAKRVYQSNLLSSFFAYLMFNESHKGFH